MKVQADKDGRFEIPETTIAGVGGLAIDYAGFDNVENTNWTTSVSDGFCFTWYDEGWTSQSIFSGQLLDPTRSGRVELWTVACAPSAPEGQAAWGVEVLIESTDVAATKTSVSSLRASFGGQ